MILPVVIEESDWAVLVTEGKTVSNFDSIFIWNEILEILFHLKSPFSHPTERPSLPGAGSPGRMWPLWSCGRPRSDWGSPWWTRWSPSPASRSCRRWSRRSCPPRAPESGDSSPPGPRCCHPWPEHKISNTSIRKRSRSVWPTIAVLHPSLGNNVHLPRKHGKLKLGFCFLWWGGNSCWQLRSWFNVFVFSP